MTKSAELDSHLVAGPYELSDYDNDNGIPEFVSFETDKVELSADALSQQLPPDFKVDDDSEDSFQRFLRETRKYPLLDARQEVVLGERVQAGLAAQSRLKSHNYSSADDKNLDRKTASDGAQAKRDFVCSNLKLVVQPARSWSKSTLNRFNNFEDLYQIGVLGMSHAVDLFDPKRGCRFSTYALPWIRTYIARAVQNQGPIIHVPLHIQLALAQPEQSCGTSNWGYEISQADLAAGSLALHATMSLDERYPNSDNKDRALHEIIIDPHSELALFKVFDNETGSGAEAASISPKLASTLESLLSERDLSILEKIAIGESLCDVDVRQWRRIRCLFDHPSMISAIRSVLGNETLAAMGVSGLSNQWQSRAACKDKFDEYIGTGRRRPTNEQRSDIRQTCGGCAVRTECRAYYIKNHPGKGIWSGHNRATEMSRERKQRKKQIRQN